MIKHIGCLGRHMGLVLLHAGKGQFNCFLAEFLGAFFQPLPQQLGRVGLVRVFGAALGDVVYGPIAFDLAVASLSRLLRGAERECRTRRHVRER